MSLVVCESVEVGGGAMLKEDPRVVKVKYRYSKQSLGNYTGNTKHKQKY